MMKKKIRLGLAGLVMLIGIAETAKADLLGLTPQYPLVDLNDSYLIYDNDGVSNSIGLLTLVSFSSTFNASSSGPTLTQLYSDSSEFVPDVMLTIAVRKSNGTWSNVAGSGINKVSIGFGNSVIPDDPNTSTPGLSWTGDITGFGWQENIGDNSTYEYGTFFDATWKMTGDDYEDMPVNMSQFVDGFLTNNMAAYEGGINIFNSAGFGDVPHPKAFQRDWVFGGNADKKFTQDMLAPFLTGLETKSCRKFDQTRCVSYVNSNVMAEVFVPIPAAVWLWAGALTALIPSVKRRKQMTPAV